MVCFSNMPDGPLDATLVDKERTEIMEVCNFCMLIKISLFKLPLPYVDI